MIVCRRHLQISSCLSASETDSMLYLGGVYKMYKLSHKLMVIFYNVQKQVKKQIVLHVHIIKPYSISSRKQRRGSKNLSSVSATRGVPTTECQRMRAKCGTLTIALSVPVKMVQWTVRRWTVPL